jgi:hypothetical protein
MDRPLPSDITAERMALGSCLLERDAILAVRNILSIADFYMERHSWIYAAMIECVNQKVPPDTSTVANVLRQRDQLALVGGMSELIELAADVPTAMHVEHYARIVAKTAAHRRLIEPGGKIVAEGYNEQRGLEELYKEIGFQLGLEQRISVGHDDWERHVIDGATRWREQHPTEPFIIERILPPGTFLLYGKPKTRKSWLCLNLAYAVAHGGRALGQYQAMKGEVLYIDLEMGARRIHKRLHTLFPGQPPISGVGFTTTWPKVSEGFEQWLESHLEARPFTRLIIVDTLVAIRPPRRRDQELYEQDKEFTQTLSDFCQGRGIALVLVHHSRKMDGLDAIDNASGSSGLTGGVDNYTELRRTDQGGVLRLGGRDIENDSDMYLSWDARLVQWNVTEREDVYSPERKQVLALLRSKPGLASKAIAEELGRDWGGTRRLLASMLKDELLLNAQGLWYSNDPEMPLTA